MAGGCCGLCGMRDSRPWRFYVTRAISSRPCRRFASGAALDIIARIETAETAKALLATRLPLIAMDLSGATAAGSPLRRCLTGLGFAPGLTVARAPLARGFRHYAFVAFRAVVWSARREEGFCNGLAKRGSCPISIRRRDGSGTGMGPEQAILAACCDVCPADRHYGCNDDRGRQVLEACREAGVQVPRSRRSGSGQRRTAV